jgi:hypothetical protein
VGMLYLNGWVLDPVHLHAALWAALAAAMSHIRSAPGQTQAVDLQTMLGTFLQALGDAKSLQPGVTQPLPQTTSQGPGAGQGGFAQLRLMIFLVFFVLVSACASLGLAPAKSLNQRLVYAQGTAAQAESVADQLLRSGVITSADAQKVRDAATLVQLSARGYWAGSANSGVASPESVTKALETALPSLEQFLSQHVGGAK